MHIPLFHRTFGAPPLRFRRPRPATLAQARMLATILILTVTSWVPARAEVTNPATRQDDPAAVRAPEPPPNFRQLDQWLDYKRLSRTPALPEEARIFYRQGVLAYQSKNTDEALRLVHGAIELDPTFLVARTTLFRWVAFSDPSQALAQASGLADLVRRDFTTQWSLAANAAYLLMNAWMLALLLISVLLLVVHNAELRHAIRERLALWTTPASSRTWAWVMVVGPFLLGYGIALPVLAALGMLWPVLRKSQRAVWVLLFATLLAVPLVADVFSRIALPMRAESTLATVMPLGNQNWTAERAEEMDRVAAAHPRDPLARFGAGWMALKGGNPAAAEAAYRDVLRAWPGDDRALDNLGTALFQQGRQHDALESYQQAVEANSKNAVAFFNLGQAYLMGFEFDKANRAITTASGLDFDRVREYQNQPAQNGALDPVPDWLSPRRAWDALASPMAVGPLALPPNWQNRSETTPPKFSWVVLIVGIASMLLGRWLNRRLPLFRCVNCDRVVCRRCAERRRAQAMCASCARVVRGAASTGFATILLSRERGRSTRLMRFARLALALAVPGAGLIPVRKVWGPFLLLLATATVLTVPPGTVWPYAARARMNMMWDPWHLDVLVPLGLIYAVSLWGYFTEQSRIARRNAEALRPSRMRPRVSTRVNEVESTKEAA